MKKYLFKISLLTLALSFITPICAVAVEVEINGLWYDVLSKKKEAKVIQYKNGKAYSGSIVIPETVEYNGVVCRVISIEEEAFSKCINLNSIIIGDNVTSIGWSAFFGCTYLKDVTIGNNVTDIGGSAFMDCVYLTSITIPNSVTTIGGRAFEACSSLSSISFGNNVTSIGAYAFKDCGNLTSVDLPNSLTSILSGAFYGCKLSSVVIPNGVTSIESGVFAYCSYLTSVIMPNGVKTIEQDAFSDCSRLPSITIGSNVETIGKFAFANCEELADVYCYAETVPKMSMNSMLPMNDYFRNSYIEYATLHVPASAIDAYKATAPWSGFGTIVALDGEEPAGKQCAKPTIYYKNGKLSFTSDTEGAEFISEITDADIKKYYTSVIDLTVTYTITVYATRTGYRNSETATATLCWIDADPQTEAISYGDAVENVSDVKAMPVLIKSEGSVLSIEGAPAGTPISVYDLSGQLLGSVKAVDGMTRVGGSSSEKIVVVRVGEQTVKVAR